MKYSVLMTVYKGDNPEYLGLAMDSMINQTKEPDEVVLVKDGPISKDQQLVINERKKRFKKIIEVNLRKNVGLGLALNEGLKVCKNELVARMDADDVSDPERCEKQTKQFMKDKTLDIVGCSVREFAGDISNVVGCRNVPTTNEEIRKYARRRDPFNHPTVMYKKSKVLEVGGYGNYRKNQDTDLWIKMLHNGCKAANINECLLNFRFDDNTYKKRKSWMNTKLLIKIRRNAYKIGFSTLVDFTTVVAVQLIIFIMPLRIQKMIYKGFLRKNES